MAWHRPSCRGFLSTLATTHTQTLHTRQSTLTPLSPTPLVNTAASVLVTRPALSDTYLADSDCQFFLLSPSLISPIRPPPCNLYTYPQTSSNISPSASNSTTLVRPPLRHPPTVPPLLAFIAYQDLRPA
ncbi:unnamed protein product [Periconia digitata]|uniref:Uncharacterized protein n=1 Tax=Periconia digitata TaxID=1303443 RepID=A0A9W4UHL2_9PLEO|nr:unnamed protein product [Periconia digitata]